MGDKDLLLSVDSVESASVKKKNVGSRLQIPKIPWYMAGGFVLFWASLFLAVVVPLFYRLPEANTLDDVGKGVFIAERAQENLYEFAKIGTKLVGSDGNENKTVQFILRELALIKANVLEEYFDMEIDHQLAYGSYVRSGAQYQYQAVQNIVVKITSKGSTSDSYLLVNSHFDSKPTSPSVGDAGHMIVTMMEVIRIITTSKIKLQHSIIFLFNGSEENSLQASDGFITSHKWAPYCKVVINLDAAGSGCKELLFQTGPNNSWLVKYYKDYAEHPFATTMAEEIFQTGIVPSDTDFDIFSEYASLVGYDIGLVCNGFVYHTKYDRYDIIPRASIQNTGDNLLALVKALANAPELADTTETGKAVFFDVLGLFFISYSADSGTALNYAVAGAAIILVYVSLLRIADVSNVTSAQVLSWFVLILVLQVVAFVLGLALPIVVAYMFDKYGLSLTYFSTPALPLGLYVCPSLVGLALPSVIYLKLQKNEKLSYAHQLQMALHGHAIVLSILGIAINYYGLRSTYVITWTLIFYVIPLAFNLVTTLQDRGFSWTGIVKVIQVCPFLYNSYLFYTFIVILTPMMGRFGQTTNPDLIISALAALGTILSMGFLILLINVSRRSGLILVALLAVSAATIYIASSTEIGFPYRPKTNVERVYYLHVRRTFYEYDGAISKDESGYLFNFQDRRGSAPLVEAKVDLTGMVSMASDCEKYMMCGVPYPDSRYVKSRLNGTWLPREIPIEPATDKPLELLNKTVLEDGITVRFEFKINFTDHSTLYIQPYEDATITYWSLLESYLSSTPPYYLFFTYGVDDSPVSLILEIQKSNGDFNVPVTQIGVGRQFMHTRGDITAQQFAETFPDCAVLIDWPADYHRYIF
ncbi:endoplasmic reticulum metallopeptidase 1-like [Drosophila eugracilis]|uniref:endoplasmic reticulum metallopeptidase 1-like n=1 Tax=Drosophila eugracilis TaxID=29029 RepID=UPI0007E5FFF8|nr:endoplasmic reticulum metallopeptidase 1-like [Drosophila eugracilis]